MLSLTAIVLFLLTTQAFGGAKTTMGTDAPPLRQSSALRFLTMAQAFGSAAASSASPTTQTTLAPLTNETCNVEESDDHLLNITAEPIHGPEFECGSSEQFDNYALCLTDCETCSEPPIQGDCGDFVDWYQSNSGCDADRDTLMRCSGCYFALTQVCALSTRKPATVAPTVTPTEAPSMMPTKMPSGNREKHCRSPSSSRRSSRRSSRSRLF